MIRPSASPSPSTAVELGRRRHRRNGHPPDRLEEAFRSLLAGVIWRNDLPKPNKTVAITSCRTGDGVTFVAVHLALAAASEQTHKVLLVDANLGVSAVAERGDFEGGPDGDGSRSSDSTGSDFILATETPMLHYLPAGGPGRSAVDLVAPADRLETLLAAVTPDYDLVVADMPPLWPRNNATAAPGSFDGTILVLEAERTAHRAARQAVDILQQNRVTLLGTVFNKRRDHIPYWLYRFL